MSRMTAIYSLVAVSLLLSAGAGAQTFSDQGMLSGSGMTILPTTTIAPPTEFRVQMSHVDFLHNDRPGMNIFGLGVGLSTVIEGYVRVTAEQMGVAQSQISYGFGGKIRVPLLLPVVRRSAIWFERTSSDQLHPANIYTADAVRGGVVVTADSNGIHPTFLAGLTRIGELTRPLVGAGVTMAFGNASQASVELVHGYLGRKSFVAAGTFTHRPFRNITLHVSPGYLTTPFASTWTFSVGIAVSTADINFKPVYREAGSDEFIMPSIEEMERGTASGGPGQSDSTSVNSSQSSTLPGAIREDGAVQENVPVGDPTIDGPMIDGPMMDAPKLDGPSMDIRPEREVKREEEHHEE